MFKILGWITVLHWTARQWLGFNIAQGKPAQVHTVV